MRGDWLRLHYHAPKNPKVMGLPSDAARWAWVVALCEAKQQMTEGEWASEKHLRGVLGRHARHLPVLPACVVREGRVGFEPTTRGLKVPCSDP